MPRRIICAGMLDSQRYWSVSGEGRKLFVHLMLLADDFGLVSLAPVIIRRRCFDNAPKQERIDKLLSELNDADLIRIYEHGGGRYAFIPRFGQVLRIDKAKCPMPPQHLFSDDEKAAAKFQKNKDVFSKRQRSVTSSSPQVTIGRMPEVEVKGNRKEVESKNSTNGKSADAWALELGISQHPGERKGDFHARVLAAKLKAETAKAPAE